MTEYAYPKPLLRVEATFPTAPGSNRPESITVEVYDPPVTPEVVAHIVQTVANATGTEPTLINAELVDPPVQEGAAR